MKVFIYDRTEIKKSDGKKQFDPINLMLYIFTKK